MAEIQSQKFVEDINQFNCPNCGNQLTLINKKTRYVGCNYCGTVTDPKSEVSKIIMKLNSPSKYVPFSFLRLGMKAHIDGFEYRVIGRTRWQTTHMEYWKEGYYEGFGTEKWVYDEWLLMGERFDYFYIVEDAEGFYLSNNIIPANPSLPTQFPVLTIGIDTKPIKNQLLNEVGSAKVLFFEGETTYQIKPGDTIHYASYTKNNVSYVIEWRTNDNDEYEISEIEFFEEKKLSIDTLKKWFSLEQEAQDNIFILFDRYTLTKKILGWTAIICLLLAIIDYQPYALNETINLKAELIEKKEEKTKLLETFTYDSVYVQEISGEKTYPLTEDMLNKSFDYSELIDPNLEFAILTKDTSVVSDYHLAYSTYKTQLIKYPVKIQANTNYYFSFDPNLLEINLLDKENVVLDTIQEIGWRKWSSPLDGFVLAKPKFPKNEDNLLTYISIQRELYSSFGLLIASFVFSCLWILHLPIAEWVFRLKNNKK